MEITAKDKMQIKNIIVNGKNYQAFEGEIAPGSSLVFIKGSKGFIMCGYLNLETAYKMKNIAAIATGVKTVDDMLEKNIVALTPYARQSGITEGMPVKEVLEKIY
ncbi:MAG: DUF1805 domain-containing protein [Endomicrobia bacterium]|nr:DUF1805 domain-containing protein [Endomicrobiia bacterium]MCL2798966.1 DUF1805 domain-containing protein [Endomicrobiia bacterium]